MSESNTTGPQPARSGRLLWRLVALATVIFTVTISPAVYTGLRNWVPVRSVVRLAVVDSERIGKPVWTVRVDVEYDAAGQTYECRHLLVDQADEYDLAIKIREDWPPGTVVDGFYDANSPASFTRLGRGEAEAMAVVGILMGGSLFSVLSVFVIAASRKSEAARVASTETTPR